MKKKKSIVERELFDKIRATLGTEPVYIKNPFSRLESRFNIYPEQYMLIGSVPGVGKSALLDHIILHTIQNYPKDLHFEVLYYSMERPISIKWAKWLSWKMFDKERLKIPVKTIQNRERKLNLKQVTYFEGYKDWLEKVATYIDLRGGTRTVKQIKGDIDTAAKRLGIHYHSDDSLIYKFDTVLGSFPKKDYMITNFGRKYYTTIKEGGKDYILYQNDNLFITPKPVIFLIVIDHIGKVKGEGSKKQILDELDQVLADARDNYGFSPIAVSQFNRGIGNTDRLKLSKGDLSPILEDFKDTGNPTESADLVLSMFDPARYKSWNKEGEYQGYSIRDGLVTSTGIHRSRSLHILKNSLGTDKTTALLMFTGESAYFEQLPPASDKIALEKIYKQIAKQK